MEDRDPDILLIKVEDLDPRGGGLSIQEGEWRLQGVEGCVCVVKVGSGANSRA